jgi:hypothetical protein
MVGNIKVNGKMVRDMDVEYIIGQMEGNIKANLKMTNRREKELFIIPQVVSMKAK